MPVDRRMLQTQFSIQATSLSETFRSTLGRYRVGPYGYVPDMTAPEGPSTGGGVQGMQHLRLLPPEPNMPTLVVGHLNLSVATAELRTLEYVDAMCRDRFRQGAPLDPEQYVQFLTAAQGFLGACGLRVSLVGPPPDLLARLARGTGGSLAPPRAATSVVGVIALVVMLAALGAAIAWFFLKK